MRVSMSERSIISNTFLYEDKPHVPLNSDQSAFRKQIQKKVSTGVYNLKDSPCLCESHSDVILSENDRYGFNFQTVICRTCGLLRTNPRIDDKALTEFYTLEYPGLYLATRPDELDGFFIQQVRRGRYIKDFITMHAGPMDFKGKSILEIGCSAGGLLVCFQEEGASVVGYDFDQHYLDYGRKKNAQLDLRQGGIENLENVAERFDVVILNHVLEHLADPKKAIRTIFKLLKEDGVLYLSVPGFRNSQYYFSPSKSILGSFHIAHLFHFSSGALLSIMEGFELIFIDEKVRGVFRRSPGKKAVPRANEYADNMSYVVWMEKSIFGYSMRVLSTVYYRFYLALLWSLYRIKFFPRKWLVKLSC
jgi:SAM-dependent methyltransferase